MRAKEFVTIVEGYREAQQEFAQGTDADAVKKMIDSYRSLVDRNQVQGPERNIDHWRKQGWENFSKFVQSKSQERSRTQIKQSKGIKTQQITLRDDDTWLIVVPLDKDTSCFHGRGTDWCTSKASQSYFDEYFYDNDTLLIYCINKQNNGRWAIAWQGDAYMAEFFDQQDNVLDRDEWNQKTGLDASDLIDQVANRQTIDTINSVISSYYDSRTQLRELLKRAEEKLRYSRYSAEPVSTEEEEEKIKQLLLTTKDANAYFQYAKIFGRWTPAENLFVRDPFTAVRYAKEVIHGRWPEAEPFIARDPEQAFYYAQKIIGGRWPEAEPIIGRDPLWAIFYAQEIIKGLWPEMGINLKYLAAKWFNGNKNLRAERTLAIAGWEIGYDDDNGDDEPGVFVVKIGDENGQSYINWFADELRQEVTQENFANGQGPGRPGDSQRHGIPKGATMAELEKASHASGRKGQLARWQLNMRREHKK
jgi:hypothetical protein